MHACKCPCVFGGGGGECACLLSHGPESSSCLCMFVLACMHESDRVYASANVPKCSTAFTLESGQICCIRHIRLPVYCHLCWFQGPYTLYSECKIVCVALWAR